MGRKRKLTRKRLIKILTLINIALVLLLVVQHIYFSETEKSSQRIMDPEFLRLSEILDKYNDADIKVIYDDIERLPHKVIRAARQYMVKNYKAGEPAEAWVEKHAYRTPKNNIIYFKYPDGSTRPMRDVFLEELEAAGQSGP